MTPIILRLSHNRQRLAILPSGHVIQELPNGGSLVCIKGYGTVECKESFKEALALFEGKKDEVSAELKAARCVVEIARQYQEWVLGGALTSKDKSELLKAMDAYDAIIGETP